MPKHLENPTLIYIFASAFPHNGRKPGTPRNRGVEQLVARQAHNLEVACSSPASATNAKGI